MHEKKQEKKNHIQVLIEANSRFFDQSIKEI